MLEEYLFENVRNYFQMQHVQRTLAFPEKVTVYLEAI